MSDQLKCNNPELGKLLPAYELAMLSDNDEKMFEEHLLRCDYCRKAIEEMLPNTELLRNNERLRTYFQDLTQTETKESGDNKKLWNYLWPPIPLIFRPAIAYTFLILGLLVFLVWSPLSRHEITQVQHITLISTRSATIQTLSRQKSQEGVISISFRQAALNIRYSIFIIDDKGSTILTYDNIQFEKSGWGYLLIDLDKIEPGYYRLQLREAGKANSETLVEYPFEIIP